MNKFQKKKIIIAHASADMRDIFIRLLGNNEFELYQASDMHQVYEITAKKQIDLLFLDIRMPGMENPYQDLPKIKEHKPSIKIVVLTDNKRNFNVTAFRDIGVFEFIQKPFKLGYILRVIERALHITIAERKVSPDEQTDSENLFNQIFSYKIIEKDRKLFFALCMLGIFTLFVVGAGLFAYFVNKQDETYHTPYANPTAMTWDSETLWVSDWVTQSFYQHDPAFKFAVRKVYYVQSSHPTGFAWDGQTLWSCNAWEKKIYKHRLDPEFSIVKSYASPGSYPTGLYFDGMYMWICDSSKKPMIYKARVHADTLEIVASYPSPGKQPVGIFSDGEHIWTADAQDGCIYKHAIDDNLTVTQIFQPPQYTAGRDRLTGMTWDGKHIWTCSEGTRRIYRHKMHNLILISPGH
ncbi:MAG: response regulator [bacterium]